LGPNRTDLFVGFPSGHALISSALYLKLALMLAEGIEVDG